MAFCLDDVVLYFGGYVDSELSKVEGKNASDAGAKRALLLERILKGKPRFQDPMSTGLVIARHA